MFNISLVVLFNSIANMLLKYSHKNPAITKLLYITINWYVLAAIISFFLSFVFFTASLKTIPVSLATPLNNSGTILLTLLGANLFFKEAITPQIIIGITLIVIGTFLLHSSAKVLVQ